MNVWLHSLSYKKNVPDYMKKNWEKYDFATLVGKQGFYLQLIENSFTSQKIA